MSCTLHLSTTHEDGSSLLLLPPAFPCRHPRSRPPDRPSPLDPVARASPRPPACRRAVVPFRRAVERRRCAASRSVCPAPARKAWPRPSTTTYPYPCESTCGDDAARLRHRGWPIMSIVAVAGLPLVSPLLRRHTIRPFPSRRNSHGGAGPSAVGRADR